MCTSMILVAWRMPPEVLSTASTADAALWDMRYALLQ